MSSFFVKSDNSFQTLEEHLINFLQLFTMQKDHINNTQVKPALLTFLCHLLQIEQGLANYSPWAPIFIKFISSLPPTPFLKGYKEERGGERGRREERGGRRGGGSYEVEDGQKGEKEEEKQQ